MLAKSISRTVEKGVCIDSRYIMVRHQDPITLYYEEFINYGNNKITYIEKIRSLGLLVKMNSV